MNKLQTIIIDDEAPVRELISNIIENFCDIAEVIATAESVTAGIQAIKTYSPDLVILDVKLLDGTAFDILDKFNEIKFAIIFITAYENFAVKAFKFSAIDYILKPIHIDELINAIKKASEQLEYKSLSLKLQNFFDNQNSKSEDKKVVLKTLESIYIVKIADIIRCEADHNYTTFYFANNKKLIVSKTLKEYDEMLTGMGFFRTHQSHLININFLSSFEKSEGGYLVMSDGSKVPVSKRKREELLELFNQM